MAKGLVSQEKTRVNTKQRQAIDPGYGLYTVVMKSNPNGELIYHQPIILPTPKLRIVQP